MITCFSKNAWEDYQYWQKTDKNLLNKINKLIKDIIRNPFDKNGLGKPERLKGDMSEFYSRRIDHEHRLVYKIDGDKLIIAQCRFHYK